MSRPKPWTLPLQKDITAHDTIQIPPPDHHPDHQPSLHIPLAVVARPSQTVRDRGVDPRGTEKRARVLDIWVFRRDQHKEPDDAHADGHNIAVASPFGAVGNEADSDGACGGHRVGRDTQQLGFGACVAQAGQDGGKEQAECIQWHETAHVDDHVPVGFPVLEAGVDVALIELLGRLLLLVGDDAAAETDAVVFRQESRVVGPVEHHPPAEEADDACCYTCNDVRSGH